VAGSSPGIGRARATPEQAACAFEPTPLAQEVQLPKGLVFHLDNLLRLRREAFIAARCKCAAARRQSRHASRSASQATPTRVRRFDSCRGHLLERVWAGAAAKPPRLRVCIARAAEARAQVRFLPEASRSLSPRKGRAKVTPIVSTDSRGRGCRTAASSGRSDVEHRSRGLRPVSFVDATQDEPGALRT